LGNQQRSSSIVLNKIKSIAVDSYQSHQYNKNMSRANYLENDGLCFNSNTKYRLRIDGKDVKEYQLWMDVRKRCYSEKYHSEKPTYISCEMYTKWYDFQVFAEWCHNAPFFGTLGYHLDKDILYPGNKIYSPKRCSFVPEEFNKLFLDRRNDRGDCPRGIKISSSGRFEARCMNRGERIALGTYSSAEIAYSVYKKYKEELVRDMAKEYLETNRITKKIYDACMLFEVCSD